MRINAKVVHRTQDFQITLYDSAGKSDEELFKAGYDYLRVTNKDAWILPLDIHRVGNDLAEVFMRVKE